jgi:anti-anti-sigma regulatory factor
MVLCNIEESIYEIFKIMRFDKMFGISENEDDAVVALMG